MATKNTGPDAGRYAYDGLARAIHEKARLCILTCLMANPAGLPFNDIKHLCLLTDGNLSRHLSILHKAAYVAIEKSTQANRSHTHIQITTLGREQFVAYLDVLAQLIRDALPGQSPQNDEKS